MGGNSVNYLDIVAIKSHIVPKKLRNLVIKVRDRQCKAKILRGRGNLDARLFIYRY